MHRGMKTILALSLMLVACTRDVGPLCSNTCRTAHDNECDDGGPDALYAICGLGTDCHDCGVRGSSSPETGPMMTTEPPIDFGIPSEYPQLNARYRSHVQWARDTSGYDSLPNESYSSVDQLPRYDAVSMYGMDWSGGAFRIAADDEVHGETMVIELASMDDGTRQITGFDGRMSRTEHRSGDYEYITNIRGGAGTLTIVGHNESAIWGTFTARTCFVETPDVNCYGIYDGSFSAELP
jgi:hypothetical protein